MNIYKAVFKEKDRESYWDNRPLIVLAASYGNAEDKAKNFHPDRELLSITLFGETTYKNDVFVTRER